MCLPPPLRAPHFLREADNSRMTTTTPSVARSALPHSNPSHARARPTCDSSAVHSRPLFFDFPDDPAAVAVDDSFMFGPDYLVAPVLELGARNRTVYFPAAAGVCWRHFFAGTTHQAGVAVVPAPLDQFPLFRRVAC